MYFFFYFSVSQLDTSDSTEVKRKQNGLEIDMEFDGNSLVTVVPS